MIEKYESFCIFIEKLTFVALALLLGMMLVVAWAHVFWRYALGNALVWSEELLRFSLVWFALLSASLIFRKKGHLGIVLFVQALPPSTQKIIARAIVFIFFALNVVVTVQGFVLLEQVHAQLTPALRIPVSIPYASVPISFLFMALYGIAQILSMFVKHSSDAG